MCTRGFASRSGNAKREFRQPRTNVHHVGSPPHGHTPSRWQQRHLDLVRWPRDAGGKAQWGMREETLGGRGSEWWLGSGLIGWLRVGPVGARLLRGVRWESRNPSWHGRPSLQTIRGPTCRRRRSGKCQARAHPCAAHAPPMRPSCAGRARELFKLMSYVSAEGPLPGQPSQRQSCAIHAPLMRHSCAAHAPLMRHSCATLAPLRRHSCATPAPPVLASSCALCLWCSA